jgi:hypothetical protein
MKLSLFAVVLVGCASASPSTTSEEPAPSGEPPASHAVASPTAPAASPSASPTSAPTSAPTAPPPAPAAKGPDGLWHLPDPSKTPGVLCTGTDPNFDGYVYPAHIAHCARNVSTAEKDQIGAAYGIAPADFSNFEFDHYIPLSIGGSDDPGNLWPQPLAEAQQKDVVEDDAYHQLSTGQITQAQAIAMIKAWRPK